jgi:hypothetical protein
LILIWQTKIRKKILKQYIQKSKDIILRQKKLELCNKKLPTHGKKFKENLKAWKPGKEIQGSFGGFSAQKSMTVGGSLPQRCNLQIITNITRQTAKTLVHDQLSDIFCYLTVETQFWGVSL